MFSCCNPSPLALNCVPIVSYLNGCISIDDPIIPAVIEEPIELAPRFYIELRAEKEPLATYKIDKYGLLAGYIQVLLKPNVLYKASYYQWTKVIYPSKEDISINKTLIKEEKWFINNPVLSYESMPLVRRDDDSNDCIDAFDVVNSPFIINPTINIETKYQGFYNIKTFNLPISVYTKERVVSSTGISWYKEPKSGTKYSISYYKPLTIEQIII